MYPQELSAFDPLHLRAVYDQREMLISARPPEVYYDLLCLIGVEVQIVRCAPGCQLLYLFPVCRLIIISNKGDNSGIICELDDMVAVKTSRSRPYCCTCVTVLEFFDSSTCSLCVCLPHPSPSIIPC